MEKIKMKNEMSKLQLFWSNNGSVIVDVPNDKVEEFKSFWNDKRINYNWPTKKPILSFRDK